jgi:hypothetical protein
MVFVRIDPGRLGTECRPSYFAIIRPGRDWTDRFDASKPQYQSRLMNPPSLDLAAGGAGVRTLYRLRRSLASRGNRLRGKLNDREM